MPDWLKAFFKQYYYHYHQLNSYKLIQNLIDHQIDIVSFWPPSRWAYGKSASHT